MTIPTEPMGSIPRPPHLLTAMAARSAEDPPLDVLYDEAVRDTIARFEATGSPVITDGEQRKYHNLALARFSPEERQRIGVHTCPGGDCDSTHSADVDYAELLPSLFELQAGNFYVALAGEAGRTRVLKIIRDHRKPYQRIFVGVVAPIDPRLETPEEVPDRTLEAARYLPMEWLGTTDDCGFAPFCDDTSTSRDTAFAKIQARILGTALAAQTLGIS